MRRCLGLILVIVLVSISLGSSVSTAQSFKTQNGDQHNPSPGRALLYSLLIPGLGHYYVDHHHWARGQVHLAAEAILWTALIGLKSFSGALNNDMFTYANVHSGINIRNRDRAFQLAVGSFNSLQDYNDYETRARNWDQLYPNTANYYWKWDQQGNRQTYESMSNRYDRINQQVPAIIALMVANRVISGISAYLDARHHRKQNIEMGLAPAATRSGGVVAQVRIGF
ncbi:MAG TPA: hypothetical protein VKA08_10810 [Balneolales bacterium]|nr:hypothetical protein [Balneolales bacterium]